MATLVLTVVGSVVGGPLGGAIGAAIGQQIDAQIFKPKGREGPRLTDLKLQTSTYGTEIPKIFGTMRVAGTVIWATDLIETRSKSGGGKGRPSVTQYSYAVSMAVAICARRIVTVRRIWADGNLLRGSAGDLKQRCTYRLYTGDADQNVDPLMASALGSGAASAHRGLAYAVFENLDLTAFGNRIPSLTFEVVGDDGAVTVGALVGALLNDGARAAGAAPIGGYAASGTRVGDAIAPLSDAYGISVDGSATAWRLAAAQPGGPAVTMDDYRAVPGDRLTERRATRQRDAQADVPGAVRLRHYDPARDFLAGQQQAVVAGGGRSLRAIDLPAALTAGAARALVDEVAARSLDRREAVVTDGDFAALALPLGARVSALSDDGGVTGAWVLRARRISGDGVRLEWRRQTDVPMAQTLPDADGGTAVLPPDWGPATGHAALIDLPGNGVDAATASAHALAVAGSNAGWRGARVWRKDAADSAPEAVGIARPVLAMGVLATPLTTGCAGLFNDAQQAEVQLIDPAMTLVNADDAALLAGANRAMIGDEPVQFGRAESLGAGRWRLSRWLRGIAASEDAVISHGAGERFVLLDSEALLPLAAAGQVFGAGSAVEWAGLIDDDVQSMVIGDAGRAVRPLSPVRVAAVRQSDGSVMIGWTRRSRCGARWSDLVDAPLGEVSEAYSLTISGSGGTMTVQTDEPLYLLDATQLAALSATGPYDISVRQLGQYGASPPATGQFV